MRELPALTTPVLFLWKPARKRESMIRAAESWLLLHPTEKVPQLDVIEVYVRPDSERYEVLAIRHHENAVRKTGKFSPKRGKRY